MVMGWDDAAGAGLSLAGSIFGANAQADALRKQNELEQQNNQFNQEQQKARQAAYQNMLKQGGQNAAAGESGFMGSVNQAPSSLEQAKKDILSGNARSLQQGSGQMQANLAAEGVRGGQAATLLNRGTGSMATGAQESLTQQQLSDEQRRQDALLAYKAAQAGRGQTAQLSAPMF